LRGVRTHAPFQCVRDPRRPPRSFGGGQAMGNWASGGDVGRRERVLGHDGLSMDGEPTTPALSVARGNLPCRRGCVERANLVDSTSCAGCPLAAIALLTLLLCGALVGRVDQNNLLLRQFIGFGLFAGLCIAVAMAAAESGSRLGTNLSTLALAAREFAFYLELAKNLRTKGIVPIATGFASLGVSYACGGLRRPLPVAPRTEER